MIEENNMSENAEKDLIDEIHDGRAALLGKFDGDLRALFDDARRRDEQSERTVVSREQSHSAGGDHRSKAS